MKAEITKLLQKTPGLKGREIAKKLSVERKDVNSYLHKHPDQFEQDDQSRWFLSRPCLIEFARDTWVDSLSFERSLARSGSPLDDDCSSVRFVLPEGCSVLLDAAARLMALANQLAWKGKSVTLDFAACTTTHSYLDRIGFFDHLNADVVVIPVRPKISGASTYKGKAATVYELSKIDILEPDEDIPIQLKQSFVTYAGETSSQPVFTVLAELFGNVRDHSKSPLAGLAALQCYKNARTPHIQTVISDSGEGIARTLAPALKTKYKDLAKRIAAKGDAADAYLIKEIFERGGISQFEGGHGLGLKASAEVAKKFSARVTIRQERLEVTLVYSVGLPIKFSYILDMPKILGTHICFDFSLDKVQNISLN
ncbi:MAG: ATP-binding protein [Massilia sp.]